MCNQVERKLFKYVKTIILENNLLIYPDVEARTCLVGRMKS